MYPLVNIQKTSENHHVQVRKLLVYQRVFLFLGSDLRRKYPRQGQSFWDWNSYQEANGAM